uniref:methyltransferase-like protein 24 isoform X2 n=1 Tax=Ciona intestinalis TaxID=7719 RepID=UPI000EF48946|nr:methyltransferase-like protein 24 isoform X2 [Ciona intestinalis]|eukprot:XP_026694084.1 methyltransferase-like protein 24 isoform X2 [Ciona intestinalis]
MARSQPIVVIILIGVILILFWKWKFDLKMMSFKQEGNLIHSDFTDHDKPPPPIEEILANKPLGPPGHSSAEQELERIWNYAYTKQYKCTNSLYLGGDPKVLMDGAYDVCIEPQFWKTREPGYKCLMYSFGVGNDFSFDDEMAKQGCEVHSFDPTMTFNDGMVRESGVTFHKIGVSDQDVDRNANGWKMRTLKTLLKELGHNGRYLDYLKVDTDAPGRGGFEDTVMQELLDTGLHSCVRQFAQEVHVMGPLNSPEKLQRCRLLYRQMTLLNQQGWRLYNTTDNVRWNQLKIKSSFTQWDNRADIMNKQSPILWETAFVNFNVKGPCRVL